MNVLPYAYEVTLVSGKTVIMKSDKPFEKYLKGSKELRDSLERKRKETFGINHRFRLTRFILGILMLLYDALWIWLLIYPVYNDCIYHTIVWWTASTMFWQQIAVMTVFFTFGLGFAAYCLYFGACFILDK